MYIKLIYVWLVCTNTIVKIPPYIAIHWLQYWTVAFNKVYGKQQDQPLIDMDQDELDTDQPCDTESENSELDSGDSANDIVLADTFLSFIIW